MHSNIYIETPQEPRYKLIKWYGWITIIVLCFTPLVFVLLPLLMMNTSKINSLLKESRIPEQTALIGKVQSAIWQAAHQDGVHYIKGQLKIYQEQVLVLCSFLKYVGPYQKQLPDIKEGDWVEMTGQFKTNTDENKENIFAIRNIRSLPDGTVFTSEPTLRVY